MKAVLVLISSALITMMSFGTTQADESQNILITYSGDLQPEVFLQKQANHDYEEDYEDGYDDDKTVRRLLRNYKKLDLKELEKNVEEACLALTLGQFLGSSGADDMKLFVRNEGVALAHKEVVSGISRLQDKDIIPECQLPDGSTGSLQANLESFLGFFGYDSLVNCPICWCARFPEAGCSPDGQTYDAFGYGILDPNAVPGTFLNADKVIDF